MESAGVTLVKGDLRGIVRTRCLPRKTTANIKQNLFFAFVYCLRRLLLGRACLVCQRQPDIAPMCCFPGWGGNWPNRDTSLCNGDTQAQELRAGRL
jgi:hypothetical protein